MDFIRWLADSRDRAAPLRVENDMTDEDDDETVSVPGLPRRLRKLAQRILYRHWRARWTFDATGLTVEYRDGLTLRFEGV